jgi:hypothetical protein
LTRYFQGGQDLLVIKNPVNPVRFSFPFLLTQPKKPPEIIRRFNFQRTPPCRVLRDFEPAFAGGNLPSGPALAEAYRFALVR